MRALGSAQADVCCIYMNVNQAALMTGLTGMSLHVAVLVFVFFSQSPHGGAIIQSCGVKMYGWPRNHRSCHCVKKQANHPLTMNQQFIHGTVWRHRCEDTLGEKKRRGRGGSWNVKSNLELAHYYWINTLKKPSKSNPESIYGSNQCFTARRANGARCTICIITSTSINLSFPTACRTAITSNKAWNWSKKHWHF